MPKITECFMFICQDSDSNDEGVPAVRIGEVWAPLVCADMARVDSMRKYALKVAKTGKSVRLVRFSQMEELGEVKS